jgi:hypothetical protein
MNFIMNFKNVFKILVLEPLIGQNDLKKIQSIRIWYQKYRLLFKKDKLHCACAYREVKNLKFI